MPIFSKAKTPVKVVVNVAEDGVQGGVLKRSKKGDRDVVIYKTPKRLGVNGVVLSLPELSSCVDMVISDIAEAGGVALGGNRGFNGHLINDLFFVLNGSFQYSYINVISLENDEPVKISDAFIKEALENDMPQKPEAPLLGFWNDSKAEFINRVIMDVALNGYSTKSIEGKQARHIEISVFNTVAPKMIKTSIQARVRKRFGSHTVSFLSGPEVNMLFLESTRRGDDGSYQYVKVGPSESQVVFLSKNRPKSVFSFNKGYFDIIRAVSDSFNVSYHVARSYVSIYLSGEGEEDFSERVGELVSSSLQEWEREYEVRQNFMPKSVYLLVEGFLETTFKDILTKKHPESDVFNMHDIYTEKTGSSIDANEIGLTLGSYVVSRVIGRNLK